MKLQDLILHDFRMKLFSLLIALMVWETIHLATQRESTASSHPAQGQTNAYSR